MVTLFGLFAGIERKLISLPTKKAPAAIGLQPVAADKPSLEKRSRIDVYCCVTTGTWASSAIPPRSREDM
jgi:hypothetical protein